MVGSGSGFSQRNKRICMCVCACGRTRGFSPRLTSSGSRSPSMPRRSSNIKSSFKCSPHPRQKLVPRNSKQTLLVSKETRAEALSSLPLESRLYLPLRLKAVSRKCHFYQGGGRSGGEWRRPVKCSQTHILDTIAEWKNRKSSYFYPTFTLNLKKQNELTTHR